MLIIIIINVSHIITPLLR